MATQARLQREIEALEEGRQRWALHCSPQDPGFWIAGYDRLARISEGSGQARPDSPEHRDWLRWRAATAKAPAGMAAPNH